MRCFQPHALGFVGTVGHPNETTKNGMLMRSQAKAPMAVYPTRSLGLAPGGLFINAAKSFGNNALLLLFLVPYRALCLVHHFIGTDDTIIAQAQETVEK